MRFCAACHGFRAAPAPRRMSRGYGLRQTDRTVGFPLVQGADMASLRTADAVLQGKPADRTDLDRLPHSLVLTMMVHRVQLLFVIEKLKKILLLFCTAVHRSAQGTEY